MGTEVRDFLELVRPEVATMALEELQLEVEGWRMVLGMLPREVFEWLARMHDVVRFTKRNYTGHVGVLLGFKMETVEYTIGLVETAFNSLTGKRIVEDKTLVIPANAVMYFESISDTRDYDPAVEDAALAAQSLEGGN